MRIVASPDARSLAAERGSTFYVELRTPKCCNHSLTLLEVSTRPPTSLDGYQAFNGDGVTVMMRTAGHRLPDELSIDLVGKRRPRLQGYWDGCKFAL